MTDAEGLSPRTERQLRWPLRFTRLGMTGEAVVRAFWPLWTVAAALIGALMLGLHETLPVEVVWIGALAGAAGMIWGLWRAARTFRLPGREDALRRLDATLSGRPIAALRDAQAIGAGDSGSEAVWQAHRRRMLARLAQARPVIPDLQLSRQDRYGLRYVALTLLGVALLFGSFLRVETIAGMAPGGGGTTLAAGPSWEGWIEPPAYTGRPSLYLNDLPAGRIEVPAGSRISLRLYGEIGALTVSETVSARTGDIDSAAAPAQEFEVRQAGSIAIDGPGGASWQVAVLPDAAPQITPAGPMTREGTGEAVQGYAASDDYGVESCAGSAGARCRSGGTSLRADPSARAA